MAIAPVVHKTSLRQSNSLSQNKYLYHHHIRFHHHLYCYHIQWNGLVKRKF